MGIFSSIGKAVKKVTGSVGKVFNKATDFISPVTNLFNKVAPIAEPILSWFGTQEQNDFNSAQAASSMAFSGEQAQRQMDFQERMSNSAYQRAMDDMKKAGLNPILAYQQGGASSPAGASGTGAMAQGHNALGNAVNSALASRMARQQWFQMQAQTDQLDQQTNNLLEQQKTQRHKTKIESYRAEILGELKEVLKKKSEFENENDWLIYIKSLSESLGAAFGAGNSASGLLKGN